MASNDALWTGISTISEEKELPATRMQETYSSISHRLFPAYAIRFLHSIMLSSNSRLFVTLPIHPSSPQPKKIIKRTNPSYLCRKETHTELFKVDASRSVTRWREEEIRHHSASLDCVLSSPFSSSGFVSGSVGLVDVGDLRHKWVIGIGVGKHGADG